MKNWNTRIAEAKERGRFLDGDKGDACNWVTCACGVQDDRIPHIEGVPEDGVLWDLGDRFACEVSSDSVDMAEETLKKIEKRAGEIMSNQEKLKREKTNGRRR